MGQFVGHQLSTAFGVRVIFVLAEDHVPSQGKCARMNRPSGFHRSNTGMHSNVTEIPTESGLEKVARRCGQGLTAALDRVHFGSEVGKRLWRRRQRCLRLHELLLFPLFRLQLQFLFALRAQFSVTAARSALTLHRIGKVKRICDSRFWLRHPHHLIGDTISFSFVFVAGRTDTQLGLDDRLKA